MGRVLIPLAMVGAFALTGCGTTDPCAQLPPPTPEQNAVAVGPVEVEQPGLNDIDCELEGGRWQREQED